ncbi:hypothetical protein ACE1TI_18540 [Alteribacillus sp. JSM 102045]
MSIIWTVIAAVVYFTAAGIIGILKTPIFKEDVLLSYLPFVIFLIILKGGLVVYKWIKAQWS